MEITVKGRGRHAPRLLSSFPNSGSVRAGQWWRAGTAAPRVLAGQSGLNQPSPKLNAAAGRLHSSGTGRASQRVSVLPKTTLCGRCPGKGGPGTLALLAAATPPSAWGGHTGLPTRGASSSS